MTELPHRPAQSTAIAAVGKADGRPAMASLALSLRRWTTDDARALTEASPAEVADARTYLAQAFDPVPREADLRQAWDDAMDQRLCELAAKIAPLADEAQTEPWRRSTVRALSDLPAMIALTAAKRAIHRPMTFLNQVEGIVREIADLVSAEWRAAVHRLDAPPVALLAAPTKPEQPPLTPDEIRRTPPAFIKMGIEGGWLTQEEVDAALAQRDAA